MKSLELGIKMRSDLEKNLYEKVIELSKKRQTELIKEGKLPNFDYTGVQIERLNSIQEISEMQTLLKVIGNDRNDELQFCLGAWESLGIGYAESFLALVCDVSATEISKLSIFKESEKFDNTVWDPILFQNPKFQHELISHKLSFDARLILSVNKLFTRKIKITLNDMQERTFLSHSRLRDAITELLNWSYLLETESENTYLSNLSLKTESKYHRAWSNLIGHYFISKMSTYGRLKALESSAKNFYQGEKFFNVVLASQNCHSCLRNSKTIIKTLAQLPPFHLGCRCTFVLNIPKRGTI